MIYFFSLICIVINDIISLKTSLTSPHLSFLHFLEYLLLFLDDNVDEESEQVSNSKSSASGFCLVLLGVFPISAWRCL